MLMKKILLFIFLSVVVTASAQRIGVWKDHLPYKNAIALCEHGQQLLVATENALFIANKSDNNMQRLSKVQGLSDVGISALNGNKTCAVVGYTNGNIDLIKGYNIHNIPHLKNENLLGDKQINSVTFRQEFAYLSCAFGIIELDLNDKQINNTFLLNAAGNLGVNKLVFYNDSLFAATDSGLYKSSVIDNLSDFHSWSAHGSPLVIKDLGSDQSALYYTTNDSLYVYDKKKSICHQ